MMPAEVGEMNTCQVEDQSRFLLSRADGCTRVHRHRGEWFVPNCVQQVHRFGGGSAMVWAGRRLLCMLQVH